ncbi:hypothetical protein [Dickeya poaceiphila]|nr:hypothetical protein [Dickeya poaceiphila]
MTTFVMVVMTDHCEIGRWPVEVGYAAISCPVMTDNGYRRVPVVELAN